MITGTYAYLDHKVWIPYFANNQKDLQLNSSEDLAFLYYINTLKGIKLVTEHHGVLSWYFSILQMEKERQTDFP